MRVVFDTNLLVRAFLRPDGCPSQLLYAIVGGDHSLHLSNVALSELARVLRYPRMVKLHRQDEGAIYDYVSWLRIASEMIEFDPLVSVPIRDEDDIFIVQTALSGGAEVICTCDRDILENPASDFLERRGISVLTDTQLMRRLKV